MNTSTPCTDLLTALCAARLEVPTITRNREGFSKRTGQKYQYADLNALIDATEPVLGQHVLVMVQAVEDGERGSLRITSTLFHAASGQWLSTEIGTEKPTSMQDLGSEATFLKRYSMQALLNISTEDDDDAASLNGSNKVEKSAAADHRRASEPVSTNGHTPEPDASLAHPTLAHLEALKALVTVQCGADPDEMDGRIRHTLGLRAGASTTPRLMVRVMTMEQYMTIFAHFTKVAEQLATSKKEVTADGPVSAQSAEAPAAQPAAAAVPQAPSPAASSSAAPDPDAEAIERDRQRLRAEVASWHLTQPAQEIEQVIARYPYARAWSILQKYRQQPHAPLDTMAAD